MNDVAGGKATATHRYCLFPRQEFLVKEGVLKGQEGGDHGDDGADGSAQVGRVHQGVQFLFFDILPILRVEKPAPFAHFQN